MRDGLSCKLAAERYGVNRGQLWKICSTSVISRPMGRPTAFDEFQEFIMASFVRNMQLMERLILLQLYVRTRVYHYSDSGIILPARVGVFLFFGISFGSDVP